MPRLSHRQQRPAPSRRLPPGKIPAVRLGWGTGGEQELPSFTEANLQPSRGHCGGKQWGRQALRHGQKGKAPRISERAERSEIHVNIHRYIQIYTDIYRYTARIHEHPSPTPFSFRKPQDECQTPPPHHTPHTLYTPAGGQALLRGDGRGKQRAQPGTAAAGPAPGAQDPARPAGRSRRSRRAGQDRAGQAWIGLLGAGQSRARCPTGIRDSQAPSSFGPTSAWMELLGHVGTAGCER